MSDPAITADIINPSPGPALSSTSDMPVVTEAETPAPEPVAQPVAAPAATETPPAEGGDGEDGAEKGTEGTEPAAETPAKLSPINQRFSDLTAARKAAEVKATETEKRAEAAERALAEALARIPKPEDKQEATPPAPVTAPRPQRETFDSPEAYDEALIEWSTKRAVQVSQAETARHQQAEKETADRAAAEAAQQNGFTAVQTAHAERVAAAAEKMPDYDEVTGRDDLQISAPMAMAIMEADDGPAVAYHLGKNPELAAKIAAFVVPGQFYPPGHPAAGRPVPDARRQLLEMGKVFALVAQADAPPPPKPTVPTPPAPITPLRRGAASAVNRELDEMSMDEYARAAVEAGRVRAGILGKPH